MGHLVEGLTSKLHQFDLIEVSNAVYKSIN